MWLRSDERIEQIPGDLGSYSATSIRDRHPYEILIVKGRCDGDFPLRQCVHRVDPFAHEIDQHLQDLDSVAVMAKWTGHGAYGAGKASGNGLVITGDNPTACELTCRGAAPPCRTRVLQTRPTRPSGALQR